jgi:hypothetical protein
MKENLMLFKRSNISGIEEIPQSSAVVTSSGINKGI